MRKVASGAAVLVGPWVAMLIACGDNEPDPNDCANYRRPLPQATLACGVANLAKPSALAACAIGGGNFGLWALDRAGLPAFDLRGDYRCEIKPAHLGQLDAPVHVISDGFGTMALAHASGGIDLFSAGRGAKFLTHRDLTIDPERPAFPAQLGGALGYIVVDGIVHSLQFADMPVATASTQQQQRFGVGYSETVTRIGGLVVTHRVYPAGTQGAVFSDFVIENTDDNAHTVGVVELYDINISQLLAAPQWPKDVATPLAEAPALVDANVPPLLKQRARRDLMQRFRHVVTYEPRARMASILTQQIFPTVSYDDVALVDQFPDTMFLAPLDPTDNPDAAWLVDSELWPSKARDGLPRVNNAGRLSWRSLDIPGANQPGVLGLRVPVTVPGRKQVRKTFVFATQRPDEDVNARLAALRTFASFSDDSPADDATAVWQQRLVYAAFGNARNASAVQREIAWSSYMLQALVSFDQRRSRRQLGEAGQRRFRDGVEGTPADLAMVGDALTLINDRVALENFETAYALQLRKTPDGAGRFATWFTGIGLVADPPNNAARSDADFIVHAMFARYIAMRRDLGALSGLFFYWPITADNQATFVSHLLTSFDDRAVQYGALGLLPLGSGDSSSGVLATAREPATPTGAASTVNTGYVGLGFGLLANLLGTDTDPASIDDRMRVLVSAQNDLLMRHAWNGSWFLRAFADSGNPLGIENIYLEPNLLAFNSGALENFDGFQFMQRLFGLFVTPIGPKIAVAAPGWGRGAQPGDPDVDIVQTSLMPWFAEAAARSFGWTQAWELVVASTMFAHAQNFPHLWYGIWTGPGTYQAPDAACGGCVAPREAEFPALNAHAHASLLRALPALVGFRAAAFSATLAPPDGLEEFTVQWPRFFVSYSRNSMQLSSPFPLQMNELRIRLPIGLRTFGEQPKVVVNGTVFQNALVAGDQVIVDATMLSVAAGNFVTIEVR
ncbi:MAG TPA: hypothetical protein PLF40_11605 [Kofleriaceae bacterium]|nr:hypothetical protein [Kofleriaceae bacterium]